jgi:hypothetical protein
MSGMPTDCVGARVGAFLARRTAPAGRAPAALTSIAHYQAKIGSVDWKRRSAEFQASQDRIPGNRPVAAGKPQRRHLQLIQAILITPFE